MTRFDVFVSYNEADVAFAERLATAVREDRSGPPLSVYFAPWALRPGADVVAELEAALDESAFVALVLTQEALDSDWVGFERSTAVWRDPRARRASLIPVLRKHCKVPAALARLKYIDFTAESLFDGGLAELVGAVRGKPSDTPTEYEFHLREDAALLRDHRHIFERPAFFVTCALELFVAELRDAVDDTMAALNTGTLLTRKGGTVGRYEARSAYRLDVFRDAMDRIVALLGRLKRSIVEFEQQFWSLNPGYEHHQNFYAMINSFEYNRTREIADEHTPPPTAAQMADLVTGMDTIDRLRNEILAELNTLLRLTGDREFDLIDLSSDLIRAASGVFDPEVRSAVT